MHRAWGLSSARAGLPIVLLLLALPAVAHAQKSADSRHVAQSGPRPVIEIESPRPPSRRTRKKGQDPDVPPVQLRYRILPGTSGVISARIEVWDRPDLLVKIPVKVAKSGEVTWIDSAPATPTRLDFALIDPDSLRSCGGNCADSGASPDISPVTVAGDGVTPSFSSDPIRIRSGADTMALELDGRFFTPSTKVLLAEPTAAKGIWKAWEFLATDYIDVSKIRVTVPWSYLASSRKLVLWPFSLDEVEAAQNNGLPLNGTEQKAPLGGGAQEVLYVANPASPVLSGVEPAQLGANASDHGDSTVTLRGSGFTRSSRVAIGRDPLEANPLRNPPLVLAPRYISSEALEVRIPSSQLRFANAAYSERGPVRVWVINGDSGYQISEPRDIQILPTATLPAAPIPGTIVDVSPSPIPLMTAEGAPGIEVTVLERISSQRFHPRGRRPGRESETADAIRLADRTARLVAATDVARAPRKLPVRDRHAAGRARHRALRG